jgi:nitrogen fixation protein
MAIQEDLFYEGGPHKGELIFNILLAFTIICIPLTVGAIVRALWLRYRITNRRVTVVGGWMGRDRSDVIYSELERIITVPRGFGFWGDMVLVLKDGSRLEMRSVPKFREVADYIEAQIASKSAGKSTKSAKAKP